MDRLPVSREKLRDYKFSVVFDILLYIFTLMIWNLVWQNRQMGFCNDLGDRREFSFAKWFFLSIITFGIYHLYHEYVMGRAITRLQRKYGLDVDDNLAAVSLLLGVFSFGLIAQAVQQHNINEMVDRLLERPLQAPPVV